MTAPIAAFACTRCRDTRHVEPGCGIGSGDFACTGCCLCTAEPKPGTLEDARRVYSASKIGLFRYSHRDSLPIERSRLEFHDAAVVALIAAERADAAKAHAAQIERLEACMQEDTAAIRRLPVPPDSIGDGPDERVNHALNLLQARAERIAALEQEIRDIRTTIRAFKGEGR